MTTQDILIHFSSIRVLTNEQIADLLICSLNYAEGKEVSFSDKIVEACFSPIKASIDLDNNHKQSINQARSKAGKASAESRKMKCNKPTNEQNVDLLNKEEEYSLVSPTPLSNTQEEENKPIKENTTKVVSKKSSQKHTIAERKEAFGLSLEQYTGTGEGQYPRPVVASFFKWWTEHGENDRKMRFEKEKTWCTKSRLEYWWERRKNDYNNNANNGNRYKQDYSNGKEEHRERVYESTIQV